jgi:hypothetical protein
MTQGFLVQPAMESYIVRIYRRPDAAAAAAAAAPAVGTVVQPLPVELPVQQPVQQPQPLQTAALAGTVQALGGGDAQTFDSAQALLKGLGLDSG